METFSALLAICAGNSPVPVNSPHKGQWRGALMFSLICVWIKGWVNNSESGDLRRHRGHYDVDVMETNQEGINTKKMIKYIKKTSTPFIYYLYTENDGQLWPSMTYSVPRDFNISLDIGCIQIKMNVWHFLHYMGSGIIFTTFGFTKASQPNIYPGFHCGVPVELLAFSVVYTTRFVRPSRGTIPSFSDSHWCLGTTFGQNRGTI